MKISFKIALIGTLIASFLASCASDPNIESAKMNLRNSDYQGTITAAERALVENPENADAFFYIGGAYLGIADDKDVPEREEDLKKARENLVKADELYSAQEISSNEAESAIPLLVARWQEEYGLAIGNLDFEEENPRELLQTSVHHLYNAHAVMPDSTTNLDALSEIYFMMDDLENAAHYMEEAVDQAEEADITRYQRLVYYYNQLQDDRRTLSLLERGAETFPEEIFFIQEQANIYFRLGENQQAMQILEDLIERDEQNPQYRLVFGSQIYQEYLNITDDVTQKYDSLFDLNTEFREAVRNNNMSKASTLETRMDELQERILELDERRFEIADRAEEQLLIAYELDSENPSTTYTLGAINENRGLAILDRLNNLDDQNMDPAEYQARARSYFEAALPYYEETAEIEPEEADNWMKLFQLYTRLGMPELAEEAAQKAGI